MTNSAKAVLLLIMLLTVDLSNLHAITNDIYYPLYRNKSRFVLLYGGAASGKSIFAADKHTFRIITERNHTFLYLRKVGNTCRMSVFAEAQKSAQKFGLVKGKDFFPNKSDLSIGFPAFNSMIYCMGLDDPEKIKSISGITGIWFEEVTESTPDDLKQLQLRMRGPKRHYKQTIYSCNPISISHHIKRDIVDIPSDRTLVLKTTYHDNRFLTADDIQDIESLTGYYYEVYALGNWGVIGDVIYDNYEIKKFDYPEDWYDEIVSGLDFGFNNPSGCLKLGWKDQEMFIMSEFYQRKLTNQQFIDSVQEMYGKDYGKYRFIADCAEGDRIQEFRNAGFWIFPCKKGAGSVQVGIDYNKRFKTYIHPSCQNVINEIQTYQYMKDKDGNVIPEAPVKANDHLMDCWRYANDHRRINTDAGVIL